MTSNPALHAAALSGSMDVLGYLLDHDPGSVDTLDGEGLTALRWAVEGNQMDAARALLARGANPNYPYPASSGERVLIAAILHPARSNAMVEILLQHGADPNLPDSTHYRPLERAILISHEGAVRLLVEYGAELHFSSRDPLGVMADAINHGSDPIAQFLVTQGAIYNPHGEQAHEALALACHRGFSKTAKELIAKGAKLDVHFEPRGLTPLMLAVERDHLELAQYLVAVGANVELRPRHDPHSTLFTLAGPKCHVWLSSLENQATLDQHTPPAGASPRQRF